MPLNQLTFETVTETLAANTGLTTASGSSVATTGGITSGSTVLTVASATSYTAGHGIVVAEAGTVGGRMVTWIDSIDGLELTLHDKAVSTVVAKAVTHDDRAVVLARNIRPAYGNLPVAFPAINITMEGATGNSAPGSDTGDFMFYVYCQSEPGSTGQPNTVLNLISGRIRDLLHNKESNLTNGAISIQKMWEVYRSSIIPAPEISETTHSQALRYEYIVN